MFDISVIIPVYNGEKFLNGCLESVAKQSVKSMEIIIVENGSADNSEKVINAFISKWKKRRRIQFLHEPVRGNSYARNRGIDVASGKYLAFVDQDDYVKPHFFKYLFDKAEELSADVITSGYRAVNSFGMTKRIMRLSESDWSPFRMTAPWGKLYLRSLIEENDIRFLPVNKGEDVFFVFNAYNKAKNLRVVPGIGYTWFSNKNSYSHTEHGKINEENSIIPLFDALQKSLYPLNGIDREYLEYFFIKTIVHETIFCAKGKTPDIAYGYYEKLRKWIDANYPGNENNSCLGIFTPQGEELKRRVFVFFFWHLKKRKQVKSFLEKIYFLYK